MTVERSQLLIKTIIVVFDMFIHVLLKLLQIHKMTLPSIFVLIHYLLNCLVNNNLKTSNIKGPRLDCSAHEYHVLAIISRIAVYEGSPEKQDQQREVYITGGLLQGVAHALKEGKKSQNRSRIDLLSTTGKREASAIIQSGGQRTRSSCVQGPQKMGLPSSRRKRAFSLPLPFNRTGVQSTVD